MNFLLFWVGEKRISVSAEYTAALMDECLCSGIVYSNPEWQADGGVCISLSLSAARLLSRRCEARGIAFVVLGSSGFPHLLWKYRRRAGLAVGAILATLLLFLSTRFVWDVRITGNQSLEKSEILAELKSCGLFVGSYIPHLRTEELETQVLILSDRLSWVAIHLDGTVAVVQVLEHTAPPEEQSKLPANLIAMHDGQIEAIELYRGNCLVKVGQAVRAGELLVSGLYDSATLGYRYTRAAGQIMARTEHTFVVEIPFAKEQKCYQEAEYGEITLDFFDFSMKIFKKGGNEPQLYDIIKEDRAVVLFGRYRLPVGLDITHWRPYTLKTVRLSYDEALDEAYAMLECRFSALAADAQLLRKDLHCTVTDDALILTCTVECIENIAVQQEFEITD